MRARSSAKSCQLCVVVVLGFAFVACRKDPPSAGVDAAVDAAAPSADAATEAGGRTASGSDEIKPTYEEGPAHPLAEKYCKAVVDHPATRRAECCTGTPTTMYPNCVRTLSAALRANAIAVDEAALEVCAEDVKKDHVGCDWPGPMEPLTPASCGRVLTGKLAAGAVCRSSLECTGSMFCRGAGPLDPGRCSEALGDGERCHIAVDALGAFVFLTDHIEKAKPECKGACMVTVCAPRRGAGKPCHTTQECEDKLYCMKGTCAAVTPGKDGEPCAGVDCAEGHRCNQHTCVKMKAAGEPCTNAFECAVGGCVKPKGAKTGKCGMKCSVL